jgi:hypothetical protein
MVFREGHAERWDLDRKPVAAQSGGRRLTGKDLYFSRAI